LIVKKYLTAVLVDFCDVLLLIRDKKASKFSDPGPFDDLKALKACNKNNGIFH
jgi:hypothetical protein